MIESNLLYINSFIASAICEIFLPIKVSSSNIITNIFYNFSISRSSICSSTFLKFLFNPIIYLSSYELNAFKIIIPTENIFD